MCRDDEVAFAHTHQAKMAACGKTVADEPRYLALRDQLFEGESVATLFEKVRAYQEHGVKVPGDK